ncbi:hypothetical protein CDL15_Pgr027947 [Punica granatum]|uniref:Uncharacterized protein n=1 Tax=Punica granatum TaxID=22663 RepID=A0A218XK58_PUNGR|nr:hypothetical protein CDL15_Pgr027947 [Punica granatum]
MVRYSFRDRDRDELSQRLIEAALGGDVELVSECLGLEAVDVNNIGTVSLRVKCIESVQREEEADELEIVYRDFVTDVTPLFGAAHTGRIAIVRKLLSAGADVNQELFRGFATTAAAREGHCALLDMLLKAGASRPACEDALLEAALYGQARAAGLLIRSEMVGHDVAQRALISACCRGFVDVVSALVENGVDKNCVDRVLLRSVKPALHANVDCTPLVAAIVSRQVPVVKYLLEVGARTGHNFRLGAWSWDIYSGEELRVGACLGEPYNEAWCAVEYYEVSGQILRLLLDHKSSFLSTHLQGRTLLCHAILCQNCDAVRVLMEAGVDVEFPIKTKKGHESRPIHLAAQVGCLDVLKQLILHGCDVNSRMESGETALMVATKFDQPECFLQLVVSGADLGLVNNNGDSAVQLAKRSCFSSSLPKLISTAILSGENVFSSRLEVFSSLHFAAAVGDIEILQKLVQNSLEGINKQDGSGLTPILISAKAGQTEAFRFLIKYGADISIKSRDGHNVMSLIKDHACASVKNRFEEILLESVLSQTLNGHMEFQALHFAARAGNLNAILQLLKLGYGINSLDENGSSPLMIAAREGNADACRLLLQNGAESVETALSVAKKISKSKAAEDVIFDHMARAHVLLGEELCKHTREGRGKPHLKAVRMLKSGLLSWGKSSRRNVICKESVAGTSTNFSKNRRNKNVLDTNKGTLFRVVTETGREVHFEAASRGNTALWVRGINLVSKEAKLGDWLLSSLAENKI